MHSTEWVNKSSGKGDTELIVNDGKSVQKYSYPYWFPFTPYTEVFPRLFPWAIFSADEEFFEENYHAWLFENGFNVELPNPTNEVVASYYGVKPLWKTDYSQGIVVMAEDESDYFIVMECSSRNRGYKHTKIILTMGGCM